MMNLSIKEEAQAWSSKDKYFLADGEWLRPGSGRTFKLINPADSSPVCEYSVCSQADVDVAVCAANQAFKQGPWPKMARRDRAKMLQALGAVIRENRPILAALESLVNGKLYLREAMADDLPEAADIFDYYAGWLDKHYAEVVPTDQGFLNYTDYEPCGVCALIVPWNFPLLMACWKLSVALAMGNTVVIKPSEYTPLSLLYFLEKVAEKNILPPGVINLVLGDGQVGDFLASHAQVDKVAFTGSTATGRKIVKASADSNLKMVSLELGGKSPNIIFADTPNLEAVTQHAFTALFCHKGEKCSEPSRLIVEQSIYQQVVDRLIVLCNQQRLGDPFKDSSDQGPQCFPAHFDRVMAYIASGREEGAEVLAGGCRDLSAGNEQGLYIRPTLFAEVKQSMKIIQEEIFGPVLTVQTFAEGDEEEALSLANDSQYGLAAGFYTADINRTHRLAKALQAGMIFINRYGMYDFASPFGGFKQSGWGKEMAIHSLRTFSRCKSVWYNFN